MVRLGATIAPWRQWTPLAGMRRRAWIATTARPPVSTAVASSFDRDSRTVVIVHLNEERGRARAPARRGECRRARLCGIGRTGEDPGPRSRIVTNGQRMSGLDR